MFITFEGIEGSGKSSQIMRTEAYLRAKGRDVLRTFEPGGSQLGMTLRRILLDIKTKDLTSQAELFLMLADRAQHVIEVIRPALAAGKVVLCDRYGDSTVAYQGYGRGLDPKQLHQFNLLAVDDLCPDKTFLLDLEPEVGLRRAFNRNIAENKTQNEGRFEAESMDFHNRVREGYLTLAALNKERITLVDGALDEDGVFENIRAELDKLF